MQDPRDVAAALWSDHRAAVVLTDGMRGAYAFASPEVQVHVPSFSVKTVDTTGCGDAFHGAYAWALVSGVDLEERVRIGAAAAGVLAALPAGVTRVATRTAMDSYLA